MSKQLSVQFVNPKEFQKLGRLDKMYYHFIDPIRYQLNHYDGEYYELLKTAYAVSCEHMADKDIMKVLKEFWPEKSMNLVQLLNDAEVLFGNVRKINKQFLMHKQSQRLLEHINLLKTEKPKGYMDSIAKMELAYMKVLGLDRPDTVDTFDFASLELPEINYSSDAKYLNLKAEDAQIVGDEEE